MPHHLYAKNLTLGYDGKKILHNLSVEIPEGSFTVIVGPNGCGKSTLLYALSRVLKPEMGQVFLNNKAIDDIPSKEVARCIALLPQRPQAPEGLTVAELVSRGRFPYQSFFKQWSQDDRQAIEKAMSDANVIEFADRPISKLSGGQSQRAWIAMVLAQNTPIILLDEPTTFLDIAHQIELLDLLTELNHQGRTIVSILHDLNQACRYGSHLIAMRNGTILASGPPEKIITEKLVRDIFGISSMIINDPLSDRPLIIPEKKKNYQQ